jgi:hypothetical protein
MEIEHSLSSFGKKERKYNDSHPETERSDENGETDDPITEYVNSDSEPMRREGEGEEEEKIKEKEKEEQEEKRNDLEKFQKQFHERIMVRELLFVMYDVKLIIEILNKKGPIFIFELLRCIQISSRYDKWKMRYEYEDLTKEWGAMITSTITPEDDIIPNKANGFKWFYRNINLHEKFAENNISKVSNFANAMDMAVDGLGEEEREDLREEIRMIVARGILSDKSMNGFCVRIESKNRITQRCCIFKNLNGTKGVNDIDDLLNSFPELNIKKSIEQYARDSNFQGISSGDKLTDEKIANLFGDCAERIKHQFTLKPVQSINHLCEKSMGSVMLMELIDKNINIDEKLYKDNLIMCNLLLSFTDVHVNVKGLDGESSKGDNPNILYRIFPYLAKMESFEENKHVVYDTEDKTKYMMELLRTTVGPNLFNTYTNKFKLIAMERTYRDRLYMKSKDGKEPKRIASRERKYKEDDQERKEIISNDRDDVQEHEERKEDIPRKDIPKNKKKLKKKIERKEREEKYPDESSGGGSYSFPWTLFTFLHSIHWHPKVSMIAACIPITRFLPHRLKMIRPIPVPSRNILSTDNLLPILLRAHVRNKDGGEWPLIFFKGVEHRHLLVKDDYIMKRASGSTVLIKLMIQGCIRNRYNTNVWKFYTYSADGTLKVDGCHADKESYQEANRIIIDLNSTIQDELQSLSNIRLKSSPYDHAGTLLLYNQLAHLDIDQFVSLREMNQIMKTNSRENAVFREFLNEERWKDAVPIHMTKAFQEHTDQYLRYMWSDSNNNNYKLPEKWIRKSIIVNPIASNSRLQRFDHCVMATRLSIYFFIDEVPPTKNEKKFFTAVKGDKQEIKEDGRLTLQKRIGMLSVAVFLQDIINYDKDSIGSYLIPAVTKDIFATLINNEEGVFPTRLKEDKSLGRITEDDFDKDESNVDKFASELEREWRYSKMNDYGLFINMQILSAINSLRFLILDWQSIIYGDARYRNEKKNYTPPARLLSLFMCIYYANKELKENCDNMLEDDATNEYILGIYTNVWKRNHAIFSTIIKHVFDFLKKTQLNLTLKNIDTQNTFVYELFAESDDERGEEEEEKKDNIEKNDE